MPTHNAEGSSVLTSGTTPVFITWANRFVQSSSCLTDLRPLFAKPMHPIFWTSLSLAYLDSQHDCTVYDSVFTNLCSISVPPIYLPKLWPLADALQQRTTKFLHITYGYFYAEHVSLSFYGRINSISSCIKTINNNNLPFILLNSLFPVQTKLFALWFSCLLLWRLLTICLITCLIAFGFHIPLFTFSRRSPPNHFL